LLVIACSAGPALADDPVKAPPSITGAHNHSAEAHGPHCPTGEVKETPLPPDPEGRKTIVGAGASFSWLLFDRLTPALEQRHHVRLQIYGREAMLGAGCNAGVKKAKENAPGHETFGFVCCPLSEEEVKREGLTVWPLALEPLLILVNRANPIDELSVEQVRAIFRGDIRNWKEVGGEDRPIVLVLRPHCPDRPGHWRTILPTVEAFRKDRLTVRTEAEVVQRVSDFTEGFGNIGATFEFGEADRVKAIRVSGVMPNADNLRSGKYPFYQNLAAITHGKLSAELEALLRDAQTSRELHQDIAPRYGLLPLNAQR
jgi:phosphate transport system substrate-binding protein